MIKACRTLKRIRPERGKPAFWIEKRGNKFIAYRTFLNAVLGIASPSLTPSAEAIYEAAKCKNCIHYAACLDWVRAVWDGNCDRIMQEQADNCAQYTDSKFVKIVVQPLKGYLEEYLK